MHWRRTDAVQEVDALLLTGADAGARLRAVLHRHPALYGGLGIAEGDEWAALFAAPMVGESEAVLPRVADARALYRARPGWWLPVGFALAAPDHVQDDLLAALAAREEIAPPVIAVPRCSGQENPEFDLYHAGHMVRVGVLAG